MSSSRQFVVSAEDRATCLSWSIWAETTSAQIAGLIGYPIPVLNSAPMVIHLSDSQRIPEETVSLFESYSDSMLIQRIHVDLDRFDEIDLLSNFARAICNRYAIVLQSERERSELLPQAPEWLTTGIAANLSTVYRENLDREVAKLWDKQSLPTVAGILAIGADGQELSETGLTACYLLIHWLRDIRVLEDVLRIIFQESARHRAVEIDDLVAVAQQLDDRRDLRIKWEIHAASFQTTNRPSVLSDDDDFYTQLRSIFTETLSQYQIFAGQNLSLDNITQFRTRPWIQDLTARLEIEIQLMMIRSPLEFRPALEYYGEAVRQLAKEATGFWGRFTGGGKPDDWIEERFEQLSRRVGQDDVYPQDLEYDLDTDY